MTLTIDDVVTHYILSSHPRNRAIVDIKNKKTGELRFIKIRHRLSKFYAVSLVDPVTFEVWAETQVKSASARVKPIILHLDENKNDTPVELRDTSRIGFEWSFIWENEKYRWVRESRMSNSLECRAVRKTGDICVAQYLPRTLQDEYFGIFSLLGYNMLRCNLTKSRELELIILMSLMTLLDKSNDGGWKRDPIGKGVQDDIGVYNDNNNNNSSSSSSHDNIDNSSSIVSPIAYEDPIPKKAQQKKYKVEALNDQKLQFMLEKDVRRSQKQIQSDQKNKPLSAGNSPNHTPKVSPLPTPSASSTNIGISSPRLTHQKSAGNLNYYGTTTTTGTANSSNISTDSAISPISPTNSGNSSNSNNGGRLSRLFSTLSHIKQTNNSSIPSSTTVTPMDSKKTSPVVTNKHTSMHNKTNDATVLNNVSQNDYAHLKYQKKLQQKQQQRPPQYEHQQYEQTFPYYDNYQHGYTTGQLARITNEFANFSISNQKQQDPPNVRNIRWNPEPLLPSIQTNDPVPSPIVVNTNKYNTTSSTQRSPRQQPMITSQQLPHRSNSQDRRRPRVLDEHRRLSASEYPLYAYNQPPPPLHHPQQQQQHQHYVYNIPPPQQSSKKYNRYSASEYYAYQQQQQQSDYYK